MKVEIAEIPAPEGWTLKDAEMCREIFVAIQRSKIPHNLSQVGTWVNRAFRDKGFRVLEYIHADATSDMSMATATAVVTPWEGERVKFRWSEEARAMRLARA